MTEIRIRTKTNFDIGGAEEAAWGLYAAANRRGNLDMALRRAREAEKLGAEERAAPWPPFCSAVKIRLMRKCLA